MVRILVSIFFVCISPRPQGFSEGKRIHKFTTEENSLKLFQVKPDGGRSATSHSSCILRNLLVAEAVRNSLKALLKQLCFNIRGEPVRFSLESKN